MPVGMVRIGLNSDILRYLVRVVGVYLLPQPIHPRSSDLLHHAFHRRVSAARSIHQGHRVVVQIGECIPLQLLGPSGLDGRIGDLAQRSKFCGKRTTGGFPRL